MNDAPRQILADLIARYGPSLSEDPRRTEGLLRDYGGDYKREIFVLVSAAEERVPADLLPLQGSVPHRMLLAQLTRRLQEDLALAEDAARWAVESWALALGVIQQVLSGPLLPQAEEKPAGAAVFMSPEVIQPPAAQPAATDPLLYTCEGHKGWVNSVAFSRDGRLLASGSQDQTVRLWDVTTTLDAGIVRRNQVLDQEPDFWLSPVYDVTFSPDGNIVAWGSEDGAVRRWDLVRGEEVQPQLKCTSDVHSAAFGPDGRILAAASANLVVLWDLARNSEKHYLKGHMHLVQTVAFSPDGRMLASAGGDKTIQLWDVRNRQEMKNLTGHREAVWSVAFSPDGRMLASGSYDRTVRLWDVAQGRMVGRLGEQAGGVNSVAFSPDGHILALASSDAVVLWDVARRREIGRLRGHTHLVQSLAFSPDGRVLASGSWDRTIRLWRLGNVHT